MKLLSLLTISLLSVGTPLIAFADDNDPSFNDGVVADSGSIAGLNIVRYSSTSAELFWDRSATQGLRYEVSRDSESLGTTNGTSFFDDTLSIDEPFHNYFVVAIDADDRRVASTLIVLNAGASTGGTPTKPSSGPLPPMSGDSGNEPVLQNATISVYSDTAAELFWTRPDASLGITDINVLRNGQLIGSTTGNSFFDGTRIPGEVYTYELAGSNILTATVVSESDSGLEEPANDSPVNDGVVADSGSIAGLSIVRYSPTSAELFWDRSATPGLEYEVSRDSESLGITNGTSFFDDTLSTDEPFHNYFVVALDSDNRQVASTLIVLNAGANTGGTPSNPSSGPLPPISGDAAVLENATISVYSDTAAELFWSRPDASSGITDVNVLRNGQLIGSTTGNSFFDGTRVPGEVYTYELAGSNILTATVVSESDSAAEQTAAEESVPAAPSTDTATSGNADLLLTSVGSGSPLSVANSQAFLPALFSIANAAPVKLVQDRFINVYQEALDTQNGVAGTRFVAASTSDTASTFTCPEGGSYTFGVADSSSPTDRLHEFFGCEFDGVSLDGEIITFNTTFTEGVAPEFVTTTRSNSGARPFIFTDEAGVTYELDGFYEDSATGTLARYFWGGQMEIRSGSRTLTIDHVFGVTSEGKNTIRDAAAIPPYNSFDVSEVTVSGTLTNNRMITLDGRDGFRRFGNNENFTQGLLVVEDASGGQLNLTADASRTDSFRVRVDTDGQVDQYDQAWTSTLDFVKRAVPEAVE